MSATTGSRPPALSTVVGNLASTLLSVALVLPFPLVAPAVAMLAAVASWLVYRRTRDTLMLVLVVVNVLAFGAAGVIDLFFLSVGTTTSPLTPASVMPPATRSS